MAASGDGDRFSRVYHLAECRRDAQQKQPAPHQEVALRKLTAWHRDEAGTARGGILVLPTGGGKTFTASHFLCRHPLSDRFKVLWLAHTHHLLEQAFGGFADVAGLVAEPKADLRLRVVSGTPGHWPVHAIVPEDDVVIASLQTAANAVERQHEPFGDWLDSAGGRLFVVFDEAHHAPARSYRRLLERLRERCPEMRLLGLTATPTYGEERKRGWLARLFPQGIVHQVSPSELMAAGVLSQPVLEETPTRFEIGFDDRQYALWRDSFRDLPEDLIATLAGSQKRNDFIVSHYVHHRERYGKTIVFADRWDQCEYLCEAFKRRGVRADAIYSHVDSNPGTAEARNRRRSSENGEVLRRFKASEIGVLVNIRMATEGTDVPNVQAVFLTRQTTSKILLTQMVGRALRGPKFGGTEKAYIVPFIDEWRQHVDWAAYDQLAPGLADEAVSEYGERLPVQLLSIEMIRRLARQMDSGVNVSPAAFTTLLPVGWYRVQYDAAVAGTDDAEQVERLEMIFEDEATQFKNFLLAMLYEDLEAFEEPTVRRIDVEPTLERWRQEHFPGSDDHSSGRLPEALFGLARHMAQNERRLPKFFRFQERDSHDLDAVARTIIEGDLGSKAIAAALKKEFDREDRFWKSIYYQFGTFKSQYDACSNRLLELTDEEFEATRPRFSDSETIPDREPSEELKEQVKSRDGYRCRCCGCDARRMLQVDHVSSSYRGGGNLLDNLQTLCRDCNAAKGTDTIDFQKHVTPLHAPPPSLPVLKTPADRHARDPQRWETFLRRTLNLHYRCAAVERVLIGERGPRFRRWEVRLFHGNDPAWLDDHLQSLRDRIREARRNARFEPAPDEIGVSN